MCSIEANEDTHKAIKQARETTQLSTRKETSDISPFQRSIKKRDTL